MKRKELFLYMYTNAFYILFEMVSIVNLSLKYFLKYYSWMLSQFLIYNLSLPSITRKWPTLNYLCCLLYKRSVYPCWGVIFIQFSSWFMNYFQKPTINSHFSIHTPSTQLPNVSTLKNILQQRKPVEKTHLSQSNFYEPEKKIIQP